MFAFEISTKAVHSCQMGCGGFISQEGKLCNKKLRKLQFDSKVNHSWLDNSIHT